jgi:hypothetical protein
MLGFAVSIRHQMNERPVSDLEPRPPNDPNWVKGDG